MPPKTQPPDDLVTYIEASARVLGLDIKPEWIAGVRGNLEVSLRLAKLVDAFPLPDELEPAPVYEA